MRQISISTSVFSSIWAQRQEGEETENDILQRILVPKSSGEEKLNRQSQQKQLNKMGKKVRWVDDIEAALGNLGGEGYYEDIYGEVRKIRENNNRSIPSSFKEVIRKEIETHSSDSDAFAHREDIFSAPKGKGAGFWSLRNRKLTPIH